MRLPVLLVPPLLALTACRTEYMEDAVEDWWLELHLEPDPVVAGQPVDWLAEVVDLDGVRTPVDAEIASGLEPDLYVTAGRLFPTVAGTHPVTAAVEWEGKPLSTEADLEVLAGTAAWLDLALDDHATFVGQPVGWAVTLADAWGNPLDGAGVTVTPSDAALQVAAGEVSSTLPGLYALTATYEALEDEEQLQVVTGDAASIELTLSDTALELYETTSATVVVRDTYGNVTDDPWTLSVEGHDGADPANVVLSYNNLTFMGEGRYSVVASVASSTGTLQDRVGPLLVDSSGPLLTILDPSRGDWNIGYPATVTGTAVDDWSGVVDVTVNGTSVVPGSDGSFSVDVTHGFGVNLVETTATDGDGNTSDDLRAVLAGSFLPYGSGLGNGIIARIHQGGFDTLEVLGEGMINATDLTALIPSPVYSANQEYCVDLGWFGSYCYTLYSIYLYVYNPRFSYSDLELDPRSGYLRGTFAVVNPYLDWSASGEISEIGYSGSGSISASSITVTMDLVPYVSGGQVHVNLSSVNVSSSGFDFDFDSWIYDVVEWFGFDVDGVIRGYMEDALEDAIADEVPAMLEDALQDLELLASLDVLGNAYTIDAEPYAVTVDDAGLSLGLTTRFSTGAWTSAYTGEGSLYAGYSTPTYTGTPGMVLSLSEDFVNQVLLAFWGGGVLDLWMSGAELGLDVSDVSFLFPDIETLNLSAVALLPPVVLPGTGADLLDLQLGDYEVTLYGGEALPENMLLQAYMSVFGGLGLGVDGDATLSPSLGDVEVFFDVVHPAGNTLAAADTEDLLEALVPLFMPLLTQALGEIPIPEIEGFGLSGITVGLGGAEDGYLNLAGDLVVR